METLLKNQVAPAIFANSINNEIIDLNALKGKKVLIKFHRFSGCPVCQCQVHEFINEQYKLKAAGIETLVFMHSSKNKIQSNFKEVPGLHIIGDKPKAFYHQYYSQFSWRKFFSIASWRVTMAAIFKGYFPHFNKFEGGIVGLPSDFLLDENNRIIDLHYGKHFGDSWTVTDVLGKASA